MAPQNGQAAAHGRARELARSQHGVVTRPQLLALGFSPDAIRHRTRKGRLHPLWPGVYAVGYPYPSRLGLWMGAALACGDGAALSHGTAAALHGISGSPPGRIHVSVPATKHPRGRGIAVHRRSEFEVTHRRGIPVTAPLCTIVDCAAALPPREVEAMVNQADIVGLIAVEALRTGAEALSPRPGLRRLKVTIDRRTFRFTRSQLERVFIPIAIRAGLERPLTRQWVNGFEVDFYWPHRRLVIETDGGTYHRTPAQQTADRRRDQTHTAAGLTTLRFTHGQIRYEPAHVHEILTAVAYMSSIVRASSPTSRNFV